MRSPDREIRPAMAVDLERILAIDPRRNDPERRQRVSKALIRRECRVAEASGHVLGYSVANLGFYGFPFVWLVVVAEGSRRRGVGSALMQDALDRFPNRKVFTSANRSNQASLAWIESLGFQPAGQIDHLDEGDPELVFVRLPGRA